MMSPTYTPLHYAAKKGDLEVCKCLIEDEKSASINKPDLHGDTPFKYAWTYKNDAVIAYLESKGGTMHAPK